MKKISQMLLAGPGLVAEVRGAKSEIAKRFDKSDKNAVTSGRYSRDFERRFRASMSPIKSASFFARDHPLICASRPRAAEKVECVSTKRRATGRSSRVVLQPIPAT